MARVLLHLGDAQELLGPDGGERLGGIERAAAERAADVLHRGEAIVDHLAIAEDEQDDYRIIDGYIPGLDDGDTPCRSGRGS
jgi:hypothetical protein